MPRLTICKKCNQGLVDRKECVCCGGWYTDCSNCEREDKITRWAIESYAERRKDKTNKNGKKDSKG